jgi:hypothetical protein
MGKFQDLKVWQRAKDLAVNIYELTSPGKCSKDFGLRVQMRRAFFLVSNNAVRRFFMIFPVRYAP